MQRLLKHRPQYQSTPRYRFDVSSASAKPAKSSKPEVEKAEVVKPEAVEFVQKAISGSDTPMGMFAKVGIPYRSSGYPFKY